jgi:hypothetical protein
MRTKVILIMDIMEQMSLEQILFKQVILIMDTMEQMSQE